jgi:hypothetical protein
MWLTAKSCYGESFLPTGSDILLKLGNFHHLTLFCSIPLLLDFQLFIIFFLLWLEEAMPIYINGSNAAVKNLCFRNNVNMYV